MNLRAGVVAAVVLLAAVAVGGGAPPALAATTPTLTVEVIGQGTVTGTGINCGLGSLSCYSAYGTSGQMVPLMAATTATGWSFDHWEDSAASCTTSASCTMTVSGSMTATAVFKYSGAVQTSTLTVSSANGAVSNGSASYPIDCDPNGPGMPPPTECSLTAFTGSTLTATEAPDAGYLFNGWGGACSGTGPSCAVYLQSNQSVSAGFVAVASSTLKVTVSGDGSVTGGGIDCGSGATCSAPEPSNATVTLTAAPLSGYVLTGWSGGCTGTQATCTVQMTSDSTVTATFAQLDTLSVTVSGAGYVSGGGIGCDGGQTCTASETPDTTVTLTAHPNSGGSVFWSGCDSTAGTFCTVTMSDSVNPVTATFSGGTPPIATNSLSLVVEGDGYVVSATNSSVHCTAAGGTGCTVNVNANTTLTLTAVPASGSATDFTHWQQACATFTTTTCTLTMTGPKTVEADFAGGNTTYLLTGQVTGLGTIVGGGFNCTSSGGAGCSVQQAAGAGITLTATPSFGATFSGWTGACSGTSTTCAVSMTSAKSVTAAFTSSGGTAGGGFAISVIGAGSVKDAVGTCTSTARKSKICTQDVARELTLTLTAKPAAGYALSGWTGDCTGKKTTCKLTASSARSVGATFVELALGATHKPTVAKTKAGYRVTLWFHTSSSGKLALVAKRSDKRVAKRTVAVKRGGRHVLFTVKSRGRYVVTITIGKHSLRWTVKV